MFGVGPRNGAALQGVAETEQAPAGAGVGGRPPMSFARILRRVVRLILGIALLWGLAVLLLGLAYRVVPPVSTLMVGRWLTGAEVRRDWTDLKGISRQLPLAVIASEDSRFCLHEGVDWDALWSVIEAADGRVAVGHPWTGAERAWLADYVAGWRIVAILDALPADWVPKEVPEFGRR